MSVFGPLVLRQPSVRSIVLQTHLGRSIENEIGLEPEQRHIDRYRRLLERRQSTFGSRGWEERKPPAGVYNCVGHVWASRRTSVYAPAMDQKVSMIFEDDGYSAVNWPTQALRIGDLATYWESAADRRGFFHVGMVFELCRTFTAESPPMPRVLSKWDDTSGEILHNYNDHPFPSYVEVEFWTDRRP